MIIEYEQRIVAFVDILGWSQATKIERAEDLYEILSPLQEIHEVHNKNTRSSLSVSAGLQVNPLYLQVQFAFFSDCFVLSMPISMGGRIYARISDIVRKLLVRGFATRGAITAGLLFHQDHCVFGPALVEAVCAEKNRAIFARIRIEKSALEMTREGALMQDGLGDCVINPFFMGFEGPYKRTQLSESLQMSEIINVIEKNMDSAKDNSVADKWKYLANQAVQFLRNQDSDISVWTDQLTAAIKRHE